MTKVRSIVKLFLPRRIRSSILAAHRNLVFRRAMRKFLRDPEVLTRPGNRLVTELIYGWGNETWSALDDYLLGCMEHALTSNGPILECGSGLSTILIGAIAKSRGLSHWALEHDPEWAVKVKSHLERYKIDSVILCSKSLKDYGEFSWYDPPLASMPDSFALVICDGPPGVTKGGRAGVVPVMGQRFKHGCVILLDDAGREHEQEIARRWEAELGTHSETIGDAKPYIRMTIR